MNVLLANYGPADNNSFYHIENFAAQLAGDGHDVAVAVKQKLPPGEAAKRGFRITTHRQLVRSGIPFADNRDADILHVWTPREVCRLLAGEVLHRWPNLGIIVHLEDNEAAIYESSTGEPAGEALPDSSCPPGLTHPVRGHNFLLRAAGITLVHSCLAPLVPPGIPYLATPPVLDLAAFTPNAATAESWEQWTGRPRPAIVVGYNGNDHAAVLPDILRLYHAINQLADEGLDIGLARTGKTLPASAMAGAKLAASGRLAELGFVARERMPGILHTFDLVVQPGDADAFNRYRLPSKIPEYLACGLPLVMGRTNIGSDLADAAAALVLDDTAVPALAAAIRHLASQPAAAARLADNARGYALAHFGNSPRGLATFYAHCLSRH